MTLQNPQLLWLLLLLPLAVLLWRWRGVRVPVAALALRLAALSALIVALANPLIGAPPPPEGPLVVLVDQSDSLAEPARAVLREQAAALARAADGTARVLYVGAEVVSGPQVAEADGALMPATLPDSTGTDLAAGLRAARALLPGGGRIVLLSDGVATSGDALAEAQLAAEAGIMIDVVPVSAPGRAEVAITAMSVPRSLRVGEEFPITISTRARAPQGELGGVVSGRLRLWEGELLLGDEEVLLPPGDELFTFRHTASAPGVVRLRAELAVEAGDTYAANNLAAATTLVNPPPLVLLVAQRPDEAALLADALGRQGVESRRITPAELPTRLSDLALFDGMVLIDVPAAALSLDQMAGVREFVRSEGRGLVALGGRNSYSLGAYQGTPLEEALPVTMDPPPRPQRGEVSLLLIVDRSASMSSAFGVSKFDMAKEAAILATESLRPEDRVGILAFDTGALWVVDFQQVGETASMVAIQQAITNLPLGGGTDIELSLAVGLPGLAAQPTGVRHAVLLTDGRSFTNNYPSYLRLMETARANEITLSTIAIGLDSDTVLLEQLAALGGGRYYYADRPADIPRLTLLESEIARADTLIEGDLRASLSRAHPIVRDFAPAELPGLRGYVATTPRDAAEVVLRSPEDDPLLAAWQYGLGRAVAWTPTAGAPWASDWTTWEGFERFWAQTVRYTLPEPDSGPLQVRVEPRSGGASLVVDALLPGGEPLDLALVNARVTLPDGSQRSFEVRQSAPGRYTQDLSLSMSGAYVVSVALVHEGVMQQRELGYVRPVPAEYRAPDDPAAAQTLLEGLAAATGGVLLAELAPDAATPAAATADMDAGLWPWLLGLALALWVSEIALRRGVFRR